MTGVLRTSVAIAALLLCSAFPAGAQLVIGGDQVESVQVDWSVLDRLGPSPSLPDLLKQPSAKPRAADIRAARAANQAEKAVIFRRLASEHPSAPVQRKTVAYEGKPVQYAAQTPTHGSEAAGIKVTHLEPPAVPPAQPAAAPVPTAPPAAASIPIIQPLPTKTPPPALAVIANKEPPPPATVAEVPQPKPAAQPIPPAVATLIAPPPVAPSPPAPVIAPEQPQQVAALPPVAAPPQQQSSTSSIPADGVIRRGDIVTVLFHPDENQLPSGAHSALTQLAQRMSRDDSLTLQLLAYADGDASNISKARRLSLSRALEVRKVLMDLGVRSTRIEVRALGNKRDGSDPIDRVDALIAAH